MLFNTKQIIIILLLGFAIVLSYTLAISKTIDLHNELDALNNQYELLENAPKQLSVLKKKKSYLDSIVSKNDYDMKSAQNKLLTFLNQSAKKNKLKIGMLNEPHIINENNNNVISIQFSLEGSYNNIIEVIYNLEQNTEFGEIINVHFQKRNNIKERIEILSADIIVQKGV